MRGEKPIVKEFGFPSKFLYGSSGILIGLIGIVTGRL